ncbi:hypothetical protein ACTA71_004329 [Dictyostelium dimigraforme]
MEIHPAYQQGQIETTLCENFPSCDEFRNGNENVIEGHVWLNISYFLGDLKSKYGVSVGVGSGVGIGKSSCLNGFVNLFNPTYELVEYFVANRSPNSLVTTSVNNISLKEILKSENQDIRPFQESFQDIDIVWTDTWGFIDTYVSLKYKTEGRVHHGTLKDDCIIQQPNEKYRIDCLFFNNYTEKEISKDIQYLRLLTKTIQLCKIKKEKDLISQSKFQSLSNTNSNSNNTPKPNQSSIM